MEKVAVNKYRSMGITIRPRNGIPKDGSLQKALLKYCDKFTYCSYVFEKEHEARHVHIQLFFEEGKYKGDVKKQFMRICGTHITDWDAAQMKVAVLVKICYNDWINNYCIENDVKKDDYCDTIKYNPPENDEYYPSQEEQDASVLKSNASDQRFHRLTELYDKHPEYKDNKYPSLYTCSMFIGDIMFKSKLIPVVIDDKARKNICKCFHAYYTGNADINMMMTKNDVETYMLLYNAGHNIE